MEILSIEKKFKSQIEAIWQDERFKNINFLDKHYAVQDEIIKNSILFIGINPSLSGKNTEHQGHFYNHEQNGYTYRYFNKFKDIAIQTEQTWAHLDLLYIRTPTQKDVEILDKNELGKEFVQAQLRLSKRIIEMSKPKVIVVNNCFARELLRGYFDFEFDNELGTYKILNNEHLKNVPLFFTSMLTGQRALDKGSYERLIWHINKILKINQGK